MITAICSTLIITCSCSEKQPVTEKQGNVINDSILNSLSKSVATYEEIREDLKLNGKIVPDEAKQASVYALVSGRISEVNVELGDYVRKGQSLAVLKSAEVAGVNNELALAESNLEIARKNMDSYKELYESNLVAEREYISAKAEYKKALSELEKAQNVASITGGKNSLYTLTSPLNGYIIAKNITNNSEVRSDMAEPIFSIADLSSVWILADVYEADIKDVKLGQTIKAHTLANTDKIYEGRIDKIYNVLDPESRTMKVRASLDNTNKDLMPGMFVSVRVDVNAGRKAVAIPNAAIILEGSDKYVIVLKNHQPEIKKVAELLRAGETCYVTGIEANDVVITDSQVFIFEALNNN